MRTFYAIFFMQVTLLSLFSFVAFGEVKALLSLPAQCQVLVNHHLNLLNLGAIDNLSAEQITKKSINLQEVKKLRQIRTELSEIETAIKKSTENKQSFQNKNKKDLERASALSNQIHLIEEESRKSNGLLYEFKWIKIDEKVIENILAVLQVPELSSTDYIPQFQKIQSRLQERYSEIKKLNDPGINHYNSLKAELDRISAEAHLNELSFNDLKFRHKRLDLENEAADLERKIYSQNGQVKSEIITIAGYVDQMHAANVDRITNANSKVISPLLKAFELKHKAWQKWPVQPPEDKELQKLANDVKTKIRKKLEEENNHIVMTEYDTLIQLTAIRERRSNIQLTMAGSNMLNISFTNGKDLRFISVDEKCQVIEVRLTYFDFGDQLMFNKQICNEGGYGLCDEYKSFF